MNPSNEQKLYKFWGEEGLFQAHPESDKKPYSLLMPPPNLTGELHLGHAMQHSILDALARFKRMQGFDVLLMPGVDHAGIQFEGTLNKLLSKEDLTKTKLGREEWLKRAWSFKEEIYQSLHKDWNIFGISADWSREVFTLDEKRSQAVFEEFKKYYNDGLVYKGAYIVQWCPKCNTAIEDVEMEYEERKEKLYYVKYKIAASQTPRNDNSDEYITIATARPETIYADTGIAIYPSHPKFSKFIGLNAINPLNGTTIPIFEDQRVDKDFGTGALKITPGHDPLDFAIGTEHKLPILHSIDKLGKMTDLAGDLVGLKIVEARVKSAEILEKKGAIEKIEEYTHSVPVCERCKTTVEPLISEEWFIKMKPLAEKALKHLGEINFFPENYNKIIGDWLKEIHDWCISRNLWWGHRMPIWYQGDQIKVASDSPGKGWIQEEKIFDTWFSSGLWPLSTLEYPNMPQDLRKYFPYDFEISAPDIKYLWIARMVMISLYLTNQIPFKNMFFHGTLRDLQGKKFSKSLGNGINPNDLREAWGTDSVRMALYSYSAPGRDGKTSRQIMDERCKNYRNFGTKIKNLYRFIYELKPENTARHSGEPQSGSIESEILSVEDSLQDDKSIKDELNSTIKDVTKNLESFQLHLATETLYEFIWHKF
ncbi:MAG: valine--tRNA ligase, partial [Candidatus Daviesbacteria bacterium]|nr:valine--tRNA ligase [Candidatus Daviesbacteria bacterium]